MATAAVVTRLIGNTDASAEIWHCDAAGNYSEYGNLTSSTWLRGIQPVDGNGVARFTTIYPGW